MPFSLRVLPWLEKFGVDLTKAFLAAGDEVVRTTHFVMSADAISECALGWPSPPNDKVWTQILTLDIAVDAALNASHELRRQAWQGELDFAEQLTIQEQSEEEGPSASHYAKGYVRARRRQEGYDWIPIHPRPDLILPLWAELMKSSRPKVTAGELDAFFVAAGDNDRLQAAGLSVIGERRLTFARDRLLKALTTGGPNTLEAAVRALSWLESEGQGASGRSAAEIVLLNALPKLPTARAAMLAPLIADLQLGKERADAAARVLAVATPPSRAAVHLALARALGTDDDDAASAALWQQQVVEPIHRLLIVRYATQDPEQLLAALPTQMRVLLGTGRWHRFGVGVVPVPAGADGGPDAPHRRVRGQP